MSFQERFRDRITTMTKEGIIGAIKQPGNPIVKPTGSPSLQPLDRTPVKQGMNLFSQNAAKILSGLVAESTNATIQRGDRDHSDSEVQRRLPTHESPGLLSKASHEQGTPSPLIYRPNRQLQDLYRTPVPKPFPFETNVMMKPVTEPSPMPEFIRTPEFQGRDGTGTMTEVKSSLPAIRKEDARERNNAPAAAMMYAQKSPILVQDYRVQVERKHASVINSAEIRRPKKNSAMPRVPAPSVHVSHSGFEEEATSTEQTNISYNQQGRMRYRPHSLWEYREHVKNNNYDYGGLGPNQLPADTRGVRLRLDRLRGFSDRVKQYNTERYLNQINRESKLMQQYRNQILSAAVRHSGGRGETGSQAPLYYRSEDNRTPVEMGSFQKLDCFETETNLKTMKTE